MIRLFEQLPISYIQVSGVETALQQVEMASNIILSKRLIKITPKVKTLSERPRNSLEIEMHSPLESSGDGNQSPTTDEKEKKNPKKLKISEGMEQAQILKGELDRVLSGVKLLGDTVDRLNEIVRSDSRCCGGALEAYWTSMFGQITWGEKKGGYSSVRLDDSSHG